MEERVRKFWFGKISLLSYAVSAVMAVILYYLQAEDIYKRILLYAEAIFFVTGMIFALIQNMFGINLLHGMCLKYTELTKEEKEELEMNFLK